MQVPDDERGRRDRSLDAEAAQGAADEGRLARAELTGDEHDISGRERPGELRAGALGVLRTLGQLSSGHAIGHGARRPRPARARRRARAARRRRPCRGASARGPASTAVAPVRAWRWPPAERAPAWPSPPDGAGPGSAWPAR